MSCLWKKYPSITKSNIMKIFKCPNCKDVKTKKDNITLVHCPCGEFMEQVDKQHQPITSITLSLNKVDLDVLNSATQPNIDPKVSLKALCGDILIKEYQQQVRDTK